MSSPISTAAPPIKSFKPEGRFCPVQSYFLPASKILTDPTSLNIFHKYSLRNKVPPFKLTRRNYTRTATTASRRKPFKVVDKYRPIESYFLPSSQTLTGPTSLSLSGNSTLTDDELASKVKGKSYTSLDLEFCESLTDDFVDHIAGLPLEHFVVAGTCITDIALERICNIKTLKHLDLWQKKFLVSMRK